MGDMATITRRGVVGSRKNNEIYYEIKPFCDAPPFLTLFIPEPDPMLQSTVTLCSVDFIPPTSVLCFRASASDLFDI